MNEKTLSSESVFRGRLLHVDVLTVELDNGKQAYREIVRHRGAVAVLVRRPDGRYILVRQFRKAVEKEMIEVVAGCLEKGEQPEQTVVREVREETGYTVTSINDLGKVFLTPGYSTEAIHFFLADVEPSPHDTHLDEDEHVAVVLLTEHELESLLASNNGIDDGKTLAIWYRYIRSPWYRPAKT